MKTTKRKYTKVNYLECSIPSCKRKAEYGIENLCKAHYERRRKIFGPLENSSINAKGTILFNNDQKKKEPYLNKRGYLLLPGAELVHRAVMEHLLDRPLKPYEHVHHKNGHRADNRPDNLELWTTNHPYGARVTDLLQWCYDFIEEYEVDTLPPSKVN